MPTSQSRLRHHRPKRSRWHHCNTPEALRRRSAAADARREAIDAPPRPADPLPGDVWRMVLLLGPAGEVLHRLTLRVPGGGHRCDQHADDAGRIVTATAAGRWLAERIDSRPRARQPLPQQAWTAQDEADAALAHAMASG